MKESSILKILPLGFPFETRDPFLFCVHHLDKYPAGNDKMGPPKEALKGRRIGNDFTVKDGWRMYHGSRVPGFPVHPHRGFETVTVVLQGTVDHADSMGAAGRYKSGDVQWMTAGSGIQHAEMFPLINTDDSNTMELFQIWLNLPAESKFVDPHYSMLWSENVPILDLKDEDSKTITARLVAGSYGDEHPPSPPPDSWASHANNDVLIWIVSMESGARWSIPKSNEGLNRTLYIFEGEGVTVDGQKIDSYHGAELVSHLETEVVAGTDARMLLLQGRPIGEPVAKYGPFVMNTQEEIQQAYKDYSETQFGGWPWPDDDPVHPREKGRFEKHPGGEEIPRERQGDTKSQ